MYEDNENIKSILQRNIRLLKDDILYTQGNDVDDLKKQH